MGRLKVEPCRMCQVLSNLIADNHGGLDEVLPHAACDGSPTTTILAGGTGFAPNLENISVVDIRVRQ